MTTERITRTQVEHVAHLSRLSLEAAEIDRMQVQLDAILDYVASLDAVDVSGIEPTAHAVALASPLREDQPEPCLRREEVFTAAPDSRAGGFAVPKVLEG